RYRNILGHATWSCQPDANRSGSLHGVSSIRNKKHMTLTFMWWHCSSFTIIIYVIRKLKLFPTVDL
ncbi:unnamed protein product, partial [Musa textilis]